MKRRTDTTGMRMATFLKLGATSTAFFLPIILAAAYLSAGQTCCGSTCSPPLTISKSTAGVAGNATSGGASVSGDGSRVVFQSLATNLGPSTPILGAQVFFRDESMNQTTLISNWQHGLSAGGTITTDGLHVVYWDREFLDPTIGPWTLFVRDLQTGTDEAVGQGYVLQNGGYAAETSASSSAEQIAFRTEQALDVSDTNNVWDIYVENRTVDTTTRVSVPAAGGNYEDAYGPQLSGDGQWIVFNAKEQGAWNVVLRQLSPPGQEFKFPGSVRAGGSMDSLGQKVVYRQPSAPDLVVFDRGAGTHDVVTIDTLGNPASGDCGAGVISGNGRYVAFHCEDAMTSHGALEQAYVRDLQVGSTKLASITSTGTPGSSYSIPNAMPIDGTYVILQTGASNLHGGSSSEQIVRIPSGYWSEGSVCANDDTTCDGVDDDCDGQTDEDFAGQSTVCGVGACVAQGTEQCSAGQVVDSCVPGTPATMDVACDQVDEDCDGTVDEDALSDQVTCVIGGCLAVASGPCSPPPDCVADGVCVAETACADSLDNDSDGQMDCWDPDCFSSTDCTNAAPVLTAVGAQTVTVGDILRFTLSAADADGDPVTYGVSPLPLPLNATLDGATGEFEFTPTLSQIASNVFDFSATDGRDTAIQTAVITVIAPQPGGLTEITGFLIDAVSAAANDDPPDPVVGATVRDLGSTSSTTTDQNGEFTLTNLTPGDVFLEFDGRTANPPPPPNDQATYGSYRATVNVEVGTKRKLSQSVYLPHIDEGSSESYDPSSTDPTTLTNSALGISVVIPANSIVDDTGNPPPTPVTLTLSSVPPEFTPSALPDTLNPSTVITIQPMGLTFTQAAPITFPNDMNLAPGSDVDIWSLEHSTGEFVKTGVGRVRADGSAIDTVSGGIQETSWSFVGPPGPSGTDDDEEGDGTGDGGSSGGGAGPSGASGDSGDSDPGDPNEGGGDSGPDDPDDPDPGDPPAEDPCKCVSSTMVLGKGKIFVDLEMPPFKVRSKAFAHQLVYDSSRAWPVYLLPANAEIAGATALPPLVSYETVVAGVASNNRTFISTAGFNEGTEPFRVVASVNATNLPTTVVPVQLRVTSHYEGDASFTTIVDRSLAVVNGRNSAFGAGWGWSGLRRLVPVGGSDRLMTDGSGAFRIFRFMDGAFVSPPGDMSLLESNGDGTHTLTRSDGVAIDFDDTGAQERISFPNVGAWLYSYNGDGNLSSITDASGGTTTINYQGGVLMEVIDPANRRTQFDIEDGNLVRVEFPDGTERRFGYDERHLMISETDPREFTRYRAFDTSGRLIRATMEDASERKLSVAAAHGFVPPNSTLGFSEETPAPITRPDPVTTVEDAERRVRTFELGAYGQVTKLTDLAGHIETFDYDDAGNLIRRVRPTGQAFSMTHNAKKRLLTLTDETLGGQRIFTYDPVHDRVKTRTDADGHTTEFFYFPSGLLERIASPLQRTTSFTYYPNGQLETVTDPTSKVTRFEYDTLDSLMKITVTAGPNQRETIFENDGAGYSRVITNAEGERLTLVRDEWSRVNSFTNEAQESTTVTYDDAGRLSSVTPPMTATHTFLADERGPTRAYVPPELDGQDVRTTKGRNQESQLELMSLPGSRMLARVYDGAGRIKTTTIGRGTYELDYSPLSGRTERITDPDGGELLLAYQGDRLSRMTSESGHGVLYSYGPTGRLSSLRVVGPPPASCDASSIVASWSADGDAGDTTGLHDGTIIGDVTFTDGIDGQAFSLDQSVVNSRIEATVPMDGRTDATLTAWFRTPSPEDRRAGGLVRVSRTSPLDEAFGMNIATLGPNFSTDLAGTVWGAGTTSSDVDWGDDQWHLAVVTMDPTAVRVYFDGEEVSSDDPALFALPSNDLVFIGQSAASGSAQGFNGEIDSPTIYDRTLTPAEIRELYATFSPTLCSFGTLGRADYDYDEDGALTQAHDVTLEYNAATGQQESVSLGVLKKLFLYNEFGELRNETIDISGVPASTYEFTYERDGLGRVFEKTETFDGTTVVYTYVYDDADRLHEVLRDGTLWERYFYDQNGNRTTVTTPTETTSAGHDEQDRLTDYGNLEYAYLDSGELRTKTDASGSTTYDYDELGNLLSVQFPDATAIEYEIDGMDRRVGRTDGQVTQRWVYRDRISPVAEVDTDGNLITLFVYGTHSHVPDAMVKGGVRYLFVTDQIGSVRLVVNAETGAVSQRMDYDPWGRLIWDSAPGFQPFGFAGGLYDPATGLVRFGIRDYDAEAGRWTARDASLFGGGQTNFYAYVNNDPVNRIDPLGLGSITNDSETETIWAVPEDPPGAPPVPIPPGDTLEEADGFFDTGFDDASADDFFRKINDSTDVTIADKGDKLQWSYDTLEDGYADQLSWDTGWLDEEEFSEKFPATDPICFPK